MEPSVGRIVRYISYGTPHGEYKPEYRAAIVTGICKEHPLAARCLSLAIFNPTGMFFNEHVKYNNDRSPLDIRGGTWHWPEREKDEEHV